jgi:signal transduction histidine kinase
MQLLRERSPHDKRWREIPAALRRPAGEREAYLVALTENVQREDLTPMEEAASQMERVVVNLVENAIKYSPSGTPIGVSARVTRGGELQLSVEDEGPGVLAADRERIFEPFFRNQMARKSNVPGHGLGLAICQSIVLAHGGRIEVTDRPGSGACFSVFLPAPVQAGTRSGSGFRNIPLIQKSAPFASVPG